jgi:hypothetical protein
MDNCIDEHTMGYGRQIELTIKERTIMVRDYGRGIPLGKVVDVVSKINTGAKYDSKVFQKSVGLNGVGTKAVNALSDHFKVTSFREGRQKTAEFEKGITSEDAFVLAGHLEAEGMIDLVDLVAGWLLRTAEHFAQLEAEEELSEDSEDSDTEEEDVDGLTAAQVAELDRAAFDEMDGRA